MRCVTKPGNAISETSKRFQSWSCVHGGFGCIKPRQKTCTHGRHTATTRTEGTQKISTHGQHIYKTRTQSTQTALTNGRHTKNMHAQTAQIQHMDGRSK